MINSVSVQTLKDWLAKDEAVLVDVREPNEYKAERIEGSVLVPLGTVNAERLPDFAGRKLVIQCRVGGRSHMACVKLTTQDATLEVYNLEGGIEAWKQAGFETKI